MSDDNVGTLIGQVSRLMRLSFDERARGIGVTRPQWQVLTLLARHEGINQGGLAEILEVEPITLGRMIDRLQDADLVERRADPADRRAWRLHITPKGNALLTALLPFATETFELALEGIPEADRDRLKVMLDRIRSNLVRKAPAGVVHPGGEPHA